MTADALQSRIYDGAVMHLRTAPRRHQFRYRVSALWLDVDQIDAGAPPEAAKRMLGFDRRAPFSIRRTDHGARDGSALRPWLDDRLAEIGAPPPERAMLLSFPRVAGWAFNPISIYYGFDADGRAQSIVHEVKNTFGDQVAYAARLGEGRSNAHGAGKDMFVSPFFAMGYDYSFEAPTPGQSLAFRIKMRDREGRLALVASWNGRAAPLTDAALFGRLLRRPLAGVGPIAKIHWQALRLWLKGVPFLGHPGPENVFRSGPSQPGARLAGKN